MPISLPGGKGCLLWNAVLKVLNVVIEASGPLHSITSLEPVWD